MWRTSAHRRHWFACTIRSSHCIQNTLRCTGTKININTKTNTNTNTTLDTSPKVTTSTPSPISQTTTPSSQHTAYMISQHKQHTTHAIQGVIKRTRAALKPLGITKTDDTILHDAETQLQDAMFSMVMVGEFSAGKSMLLNAMLGDNVCETGVLPTTAEIHIIRSGERAHTIQSDETLRQVVVERRKAPKMLEDLAIVDTPGSNSLFTSHDRITQQFIPRADLIIFVSSFDRPLSESERVFLERIQTWAKKCILVVNKADLAKDAREIDLVTSFVASNAKQVLNVTPTVFAVSAKQAVNARMRLQESPNNAEAVKMLEESGMLALESCIMNILGSVSKLQLKLTTPIAVADRILKQYYSALESRRKSIDSDTKLLELLNKDIERFRIDAHNELQMSLTKLDLIFLHMADASKRFVEDNISFMKLPSLWNTELLQSSFRSSVSEKVVDDVYEQVNVTVGHINEKAIATLQQLSNDLAKHNLHDARSNSHAGLLENAGRSILDLQNKISQAINEKSQAEHANIFAIDARSLLMQTAALEISAVGIGVLAALAAADIGLAGAGTLAVGGLWLLPQRKASMKAALQQRINASRDTVASVLIRHIERVTDEHARSLLALLGPFERHCRNEQQQLKETEEQLDHIATELVQARESVSSLLALASANANMSAPSSPKFVSSA